MFFEEMQEAVTLSKADGRTFETRALVQRKMILVTDPSIPIEVGDVISRTLPSGVTERYEVVDPGFHSGKIGLPAHYQAKVRNAAARPPIPHSVTHNYNAHQVAAMGPGAVAVGNSLATAKVAQTWTQQDRSALETELVALVKFLALSVAADPDIANEVGSVAAAKTALVNNDETGFAERLKLFGKRTWDCVEQLGLECLKLRARHYVGLPAGE